VVLFRDMYARRNIEPRASAGGFSVEDKAQYFEIVVSGDPKDSSSIVSFINMTHRRVLNVDPNADVRTYDFMKRRYRIIWSGLPIDMNQMDTVFLAVLRYAARFLDDWSMAIEFFRVERGGF